MTCLNPARKFTFWTAGPDVLRALFWSLKNKSGTIQTQSGKTFFKWKVQFATVQVYIMHQCLLFCNKKELTEEAKKKLTGLNGNVMCGKQELWSTQFPVLNSGMLTTEQHCLPSIIVSLGNRTAERRGQQNGGCHKRDGAITCKKSVFCQEFT